MDWSAGHTFTLTSQITFKKVFLMSNDDEKVISKVKYPSLWSNPSYSLFHIVKYVVYTCSS